jgi:hypothetical protein
MLELGILSDVYLVHLNRGVDTIAWRDNLLLLLIALNLVVHVQELHGLNLNLAILLI